MAELETDPEEIRRLTDVRRRRRRPHRRRDGRADRRAGAHDAAAGLPRIDTSQARGSAAGRPVRRARPRSDRRCRRRRPSSSSSLGIEVWLEHAGHVGRRARHRRSGTAPAGSTASMPTSWCGRPACGRRRLAAKIADQAGVETDRAGRIPVNPDFTAAGPSRGLRRRRHDDASTGYPASRRSRCSSGRYAARTDQAPPRAASRPGAVPLLRQGQHGDDLAVPRGRRHRPASRLRFGGFIAWLLWLGVHIFYLVGFKNRVTTCCHWAVTLPRPGPSTKDHHPSAGRRPGRTQAPRHSLPRYPRQARARTGRRGALLPADASRSPVRRRLLRLPPQRKAASPAVTRTRTGNPRVWLIPAGSTAGPAGAAARVSYRSADRRTSTLPSRTLTCTVGWGWAVGPLRAAPSERR